MGSTWTLHVSFIVFIFFFFFFHNDDLCWLTTNVQYVLSVLPFVL